MNLLWDREWPQTKLWTPASLNPRCCRCEGADRRNYNQNVFVLRNISNLAAGLFSAEITYHGDVRQPCLWQPGLVSSIKQYTGGLPHLTSPHLTRSKVSGIFTANKQGCPRHGDCPGLVRPGVTTQTTGSNLLTWNCEDQARPGQARPVRPGQTRVMSLYHGQGLGRRGEGRPGVYWSQINNGILTW